MTDDLPTGVAKENFPFATPLELRAMADLAERLNETHAGWEASEYPVSFDDVAVYDESGIKIAVLVWRTEADSFAVTLGD